MGRAEEPRGSAWARGLVALFPPSFREAVGADLVRLLDDRGREMRRLGWAPWVRYRLSNTLRCLADAAGEWVVVGARTVHTVRGGDMGTLVERVAGAGRSLIRHPSYSVPAALTLALGIAANATMFSVLYGVVIRPLPYPDADRLVRVAPARAGGAGASAFSLPDVEDWGRRSARLSALGAYTTLPSDLVLTDGSAAREVETARVTAGFFQALGTPPLLGRYPTEVDERGDARVLVVSHGLWQRRFGGDPGVAGAGVEVDGVRYTVVGVTPPEFAFPDPRVEVWALLADIPASSIPLQYRGVRLLDAVGRLAPGATLADARAELDGVASTLAEAFPESNGEVPAASVVPLHQAVVGDVDRALVVLMIGGLGMLAVVCANLANLALAREARRQGDLAVRLALGASRSRLMGLVVTESLLLGVVGGLVGLLLAQQGTAAVAAAASELLPRAAEIRMNGTVALVSLVAAMGTGLVFGVLPGLRAGRTGVAGTLRRTRTVTGRAHDGLVAAQVALALVLTVGASLLARSLGELSRVDPGFRAEGLVVAEMTFSATRFPDRTDYLPRFDAVREALARAPGVVSVAVVRRFPFRGQGESIRWVVPGRPGGDPDGAPGRLLQVDGPVFDALGARLAEGPGFSAADLRDGRAVAVVSEALAAEAFPDGGTPVGRTLEVGGGPFEIVGVVDDIRQEALDRSGAPTLYVPNRTAPRRGGAFVLRVQGDVGPVLRRIREALSQADPDQAITALAPATELVGGQLSRPRLFAVLLGLLAGMALLLAALGVYGVVSMAVVDRRREVGVRLALGSTSGRVLYLVVAQALRPVVAGVVAGTVAAVLGTTLLARLLYGVDAHDPLAFGTAVGTLLAVGLLGSWLPARWASRLAPTEALAQDG
ncbi:MAG: ADOP family duplicated permease [Longimicrobiales bacterium]